ncbi:hypothetical protein EDD29_0132 [Actinocorallia herbida]|uniref:Uncharacterized protein n=1 Tax=Actinocorallia herbida TaxID=58109 RepID=A0A3N1CMV7_9ACTN|nr:hypothetical protein EDD29_0132 [Actinocorallia herbida]
MTHLDIALALFFSIGAPLAIVHSHRGGRR